MSINKNFVIALVARDLRRYFSNPTGYVFITLFIFLSAAAAFWQDRFFLNNLANLDQLNGVFPFILLFFVPALTMSIWSEERKQATDELLLTMPATSFEVILGKYLSALGIFVASLILSLSHVIVLFWLGSPDLGAVFSNYLGYALLGGTLISAGMLASLLTANTAIAFILGALFCTGLLFADAVFRVVSPFLGNLLEPVGVIPHFSDFSRGVIPLSGLFYFISVTGLFLFINTLVVDRRHWPKELEGRPTWLHQAIRVVGLLLIVVSVNILLARTGLRLDVTAEGLHSLSHETRQLLSGLSEDRPVFVQAFVSPEVPEPYVQARANLLSTLREIDAIGGGAVKVLIDDTEPFSQQAREAREKFGIVPNQVPNLEGARAGFSDVFMGVAITSGAAEQVVPFLDRGLSPEYEIVRGIRVVSHAQRPRVGVLQTAINLFGGLDFQTMRSSPAWPVVDELKKQYEVVRLQPGGEIPEDLDGLLVVLPSSLPQEELDALESAIQGGLPTLLLVDPLPLINPSLAPSETPGANQNPFMQNQAPQRPKGDIGSFMARLGVSWDSGRIVWDSYNPHPDLAHLPPEAVFVGKGSESSEAFNRERPETAPLQELVLLYAGELERAIDSKAEFIPLIRSGRLSGHFAYPQVIQRSFFGTQLNRNLPHRPDDREYVMAAEVKGVGATFSEPEESEGEESSDSGGDEESVGGAGSSSMHVIVVADVDFISDQFFQIRARGLQNLTFDNVSFFLNCMDVLAGDRSFIDLRSKRIRHRTLERVEAQTRDFVEQRVGEEKQAEAEAEVALQEAQQRLDEKVKEVENRPDLDVRTKQIMARNLQESENRRFEVLKANIESQKEAKVSASREKMEEQIRSIQNNIRMFAVVLPPIPVFLLGVWIFVRRQRREREGAAAARRLRA